MSKIDKSEWGELGILCTHSMKHYLTKEICDILEFGQMRADHEEFADTTLYKRIKDTVRGKDLFLIVPSIPPREQRQSELEEFIEAANKDSRRITIVYPTLDKSRQDRRNEPGEANDIVKMAKTWEALGADRLMTVDLHNEISAGIFEARDIAVDNLSAAPIFAFYIVNNFNISQISIASPDANGAARAKRLRNLVYKAARAKMPQLDPEFHIPIAIIDKKRTGHHKSEVEHVIGDVGGKIVIVYDDMIDTA
ncbi:ribose-phosphate diphosphokinase, partial [Candidatus Woesearchaeota archaeon]|nr:ribose-phosphate diphosphokinase [Candidatus Woesearchaeota archaeon]